MFTIKSRKDFEQVFSHGKQYSTRLFFVRTAARQRQRDQHGRVAFAAGKRLGNAVYRNRCKRVMREGVRRGGGPWPSHDVIFIAKRQVATATPAQVDEAISEVVRHLSQMV